MHPELKVRLLNEPDEAMARWSMIVRAWWEHSNRAAGTSGNCG